MAAREKRTTIQRTRPLVLVVDPDRMSSLIIARVLDKADFAVECVSDAAGGLEIIAQRQTAFVICEMRLPDIPASAFIAKAKQLYEPKPLPVLVLSTDLRPPQRLSLLQAGVLDCLAKPIEAEELRIRIERALHGTEISAPGTAMHLSGDLERFGLPDVLVMLDLARYTGQLDIAGARERGSIELVGGRPLHATYGRHVGMEAFVSIMRLAKGWFRVHAGEPSNTRTLSGSTTHLILEASVTEAHRRRTPSIRADRLEELGVTKASIVATPPDRGRLAARLALQILDPLRLGELELATRERPDPADSIAITMFGDVSELVGMLWEQSSPISPDLLVRASKSEVVLRWVFQGRQQDKLVVRIVDLEESSTSWFHLRSDVVLVAASQAGPFVVDPAVRAYVLGNQLPALVLANEHEAGTIFSPAPFNTIKILGKRLYELRGQGRSVIADALRMVKS